MIKVIVGYKVREGADIQQILLQLRSQAMTYTGFMSAENLTSEKDRSVSLMISTWEKTGDWRTWEQSKISQDLLKQAEALLVEEPKVTIYRMMPTVRWVR